LIDDTGWKLAGYMEELDWNYLYSIKSQTYAGNKYDLLVGTPAGSRHINSYLMK
jgi:hypothetical protein